MDDAQQRAKDFTTQSRIRELEHEIVRLRKTLPDRLQAMVEQAEADGLYEKLDVTAEQVRIAELEGETRRLSAMLTRLFEHHQRHDPDPQCPTCGGVEAYLAGLPLTEDQQREFEQP